MDAELKAKWIKSIQETPLHRGGGYTEATRSLYEDKPNLTCPACALGKLYQIIHSDYPNIVKEYEAFVMERKLGLRARFSVSELLFFALKPDQFELTINWNRIVHINDNNLEISDEEAKKRLVELIQANF